MRNRGKSATMTPGGRTRLALLLVFVVSFVNTSYDQQTWNFRPRDSGTLGHARRVIRVLHVLTVLAGGHRVERLIGSMRRECLDHVIVLNERHLRRLLSAYVDYYHQSRTHLALMKDAPEPRPVVAIASGRVVALPAVGGLHHRERRAA